MATRKKPVPKTFKAAYQILKTNAEALQDSNEPDIDSLMTTVEQSIAAYKVCQSRIEAVQQALDAAFDEDSADTADDAPTPQSIESAKPETVEPETTEADTTSTIESL